MKNRVVGPPSMILGLLVMFLLPGCTTRPTIDWSSRIGNYTFDQAVIDYGPPDKAAQLSDHSTVAEWLTRRGGYYTHSFGYGYYGPYHPYGYYSGFAYAPYTVTRYPDRFLRLVFDPEGRLKGFNQFDE